MDATANQVNQCNTKDVWRGHVAMLFASLLGCYEPSEQEYS